LDANIKIEGISQFSFHLIVLVTEGDKIFNKILKELRTHSLINKFRQNESLGYPFQAVPLLKVFPAICQIVHCFYNLSGVSVLIIKVATAKKNM